jgi:hypothetical protein
MMHRRLNVGLREGTATVTAETYDAPGPGTTLVDGIEVIVYWHSPTNGDAPYVVVEVDGDSPVKIVRHDGTVLDESEAVA